MIEIRLNTTEAGYEKLLASVRKELKRQRATIVSDTVDDDEWRIITAQAA